jgi:hypothetical protein
MALAGPPDEPGNSDLAIVSSDPPADRSRNRVGLRHLGAADS